VSAVRRAVARAWRPVLLLAVGAMVVAAVCTAVGADGLADTVALVAWAALLVGGGAGLVGADR